MHQKYKIKSEKKWEKAYHANSNKKKACIHIRLHTRQYAFVGKNKIKNKGGVFKTINIQFPKLEKFQILTENCKMPLSKKNIWASRQENQ